MTIWRSICSVSLFFESVLFSLIEPITNEYFNSGLLWIINFAEIISRIFIYKHNLTQLYNVYWLNIATHFHAIRILHQGGEDKQKIMLRLIWYPILTSRRHCWMNLVMTILRRKRRNEKRRIKSWVPIFFSSMFFSNNTEHYFRTQVMIRMIVNIS